MSLSDALAQLRDDTLAALDETHDYYVYTKIAWRLVQQLIERHGHKIAIENHATHTKVTEIDLLALAQRYVTRNLASATFQDFVSTFESFYCDMLRLWLTRNPNKLKKKQIEFW